jgi:BirA family biotin operon repressor/biotin-[acetyl-CoA-carboxylase] ligase
MVIHDRLDPDKIGENLGTSLVGKKILVYDQTSSTNDIAAEYAKKGHNDGLVVFAEEQTAGRGRTGAKWHSEYGESILCSIVLNGNTLSSEMMSLTSAVATADALGRVGRSSAKIKWPNDILINGKKIAGILVESKRSGHRNSYIVGIGINCHQQKESFPPELQGAATSIDIEGRAVCDRVSMARRLLASIDQWLEVSRTNLGEVTSRWMELNMQLGHRVAVVCSGKRFVGNCVGIDPEKGLVLQLDSGLVRMFPAAHTTIDKGK